MQLDTPIDSDELRLQTLTQAQASERYLAWLLNPEINQYLESRFATHSIEKLADFIDTANASNNELLLGIFHRSSGEHIGNIKLGPIDFNHRHAAIGIIIGESGHWGKSYAAKAIRSVSEYAFEHLELERLFAGCYASNSGSLKAFLKAGFEQEATLRGHWRCNGRREDGIQMGLLKSGLKNAGKA